MASQGPAVVSHQPLRTSLGSFTTAPESLATSLPRSAVATSQSKLVTPGPLFEEPQDTKLDAVADAPHQSNDVPSSSNDLSKSLRVADTPPQSSSIDGGNSGATAAAATATVAASNSRASAAAPFNSTALRPNQQHVSYEIAASHRPNPRPSHVPSPSASFPPMIPALPGDGHMSGPYPSLRPFSAFEPLQPSLSPHNPNFHVLLPSSDAQPSPSPHASPNNKFTTSPVTSRFPATGDLLEANSNLPPSSSYYQDPSSSGTRPGPPPPQPTLADVPKRTVEPEICVECMMRDQDMADVDVGPGTWARDSDVDFYDALAAYQESRRQGSTTTDARSSSQHHGPSSSLLHVQTGTSPDSEESGYAASASATSYEKSRNLKSSSSAAHHTPSQRKKVSPGNQLLAHSLETWNSISTPVSNFRWRNLLAYLEEQAQYLDPEAVEAEVKRMARRKAMQRARAESQEREAAARAQERDRRRTRSTMVSANLDDVETTFVAPKPAREPRLVSSNSSPNVIQKAALEEPSRGPYLAPDLAASNASMPSLQVPPRRFSSPMPDAPVSGPMASSTSARPHEAGLSPASPSRPFTPRAQSPGAFSERPRSMWSNFSRFKRNNGSMFSLAPSGASMMDMHLGLSVDRHQPTSNYEQRQRMLSQQDAAVAAAAAEYNESGKRKRKKGIKKFISKLFVGPRSPRVEEMQSPPLALDLSYLSGDSNEPLEPPLPSYLAGSGTRHDRSASSSSQSSLPHSPKDLYPGPTFGQPSSFYYDQPSSPADSSHLLTAQPLNTHASSDPYLHRMSTDKPLPPPTDPAASLTADVRNLRREKSLPSLPPDDLPFGQDVLSAIERPYSQVPLDARVSNVRQQNAISFDGSRSVAGYSDDGESIGGGRKSRARPKIFTRPFMKRKESKELAPCQQHHQKPSMISKEDFMALYYPSSS